jgi:hypothetical protein
VRSKVANVSSQFLSHRKVQHIGAVQAMVRVNNEVGGSTVHRL